MSTALVGGMRERRRSRCFVAAGRGKGVRLVGAESRTAEDEPVSAAS
ncbi:hypothetical protein [Nocardia ninae]|nr:hypothetical protein [Nocardia ninae]